MESIRIKNLRSLKDTEEIEIKNINLLVGQNSSGKSTFLRTFPLLRQSMLRDTKGPILWYDDSLVDFGSYEDSINRFADETEGISLIFKLRLKDRPRFSFFGNRLSVKEDLLFNIELTILEKNRTNYISELKIYFEDQNILINSNHKGQVEEFKVNDSDMMFSEGTFNFQKFNSNAILPTFFISSKNNNEREREYYFLKAKDMMVKIISRNLKNQNRIDKILNSSLIGSKKDLLTSLSDNNLRTWNKKIELWDIDNPNFIELNNLIISNSLPSLIFSIDDALKTFFKDSKYIAPVRAKALRYYRYQDLSVSEIDAYGDNLHMFLENLSRTQKEDYQKFIKKVFGFTAVTESKSGHITINIKDKKDQSFNLADLGFGYSQVLPIITKLWYASSKKNNSFWTDEGKKITILIEQPELHLHPAMQAQLADAFILSVDLAKDNDVILNLIIETHSSTIINRIGRRIIDEKISQENVNITIFDLDDDLKNSVVQTTQFSKNGVLKNWPLGFFEPKN